MRNVRKSAITPSLSLSPSIIVMILALSCSISSHRRHLSFALRPSHTYPVMYTITDYKSLHRLHRRTRGSQHFYNTNSAGSNDISSSNGSSSPFVERKELRWGEYLSLSKEVNSVVTSFTTSSSKTTSSRQTTHELDGVIHVSSKYAAKRAAMAGRTTTSDGDDDIKGFSSFTVSAVADSNPLTRVSVASRSGIAFRSFEQRLSATSGNSGDKNNINIKSKRSSFKIPQIQLTPEEKELFGLLKQVVSETNLKTTLRVAGGWVRDKLLATKEFRKRYEGTTAGGDFLFLSLSSPASQQGASKGRKGTGIIGGGAATKSLADEPNSSSREHQQPVDIDIALDDMLGREFADHLNEWLSTNGRRTVSVGMVLKNPEKSKHLETATMKVNQFWIDFVNLRAEEYTDESSRIPDLMRIGTPDEDAFRRDLTINSLFYNINTEIIEDLTGSGVKDLFDGIISTPLHPLTTLLDDPLRVLRSVRFAARLRFSMDEGLRDAARDPRVHDALVMKVSRERVGGEVDLMLRSYDPVGAIRLLINLNLIDTVFPISRDDVMVSTDEALRDVYSRGLVLLSTTHDHLCDCKRNPPVWCQQKHTQNAMLSPRALSLGSGSTASGTGEVMLVDDEESRRLLWYASFLKPLRDQNRQSKQKHSAEPITPSRRQGKKAHQSIVMKVMIDDLKRSVRDAEDVERIQKGAEDFSKLIIEGGAISASAILQNGIKIRYRDQAADDGAAEIFNEFTMNDYIICTMAVPGENEEYIIDPVAEQDPRWLHAMEFRLLCSKLLHKVNNRWRAALILSLSEQLSLVDQFETTYAIEGDVVEQINEDLKQRVISQYDAFAAALVQLGLIGIWNQKPLIDGDQLKQKDILPNLMHGPMFREVIEEQMDWMTAHPGGDKDALIKHLQSVFLAFAPK